MRAAFAVAVVLLSGCASDRLNVSPPAGVDFSGKWKLNEADSDDPLHLLQSQNSATGPRETNDGTGGARGGRRGGSRAGPGGSAPGYAGPPPPPMGAMSGPLRWPGKQLEVKQVAGVVAFTSEGRNRVCQPASERKPRHKPDPHDRDSFPAGRDATPPVCGWSESTLIVKGGDADDDRAAFEEHYELSDDRRRLVETVVFLGGRSSGYTLSRVWDRVIPAP